MAANKNENNISLGITADSYFDASEKDALTGMKNKRAYSQYEKQLNSLIKKGSAPNFAVIVFDINDVTQVNDNIGHTAGDKFIKKGCYLICDTFKQSPVFHIGEDQFVALLMWGDYENRSILVERLKEIQSENAKSGLQTIAFGMADFSKGKDSTLQIVFERAKKLMYENKHMIKSTYSLDIPSVINSIEPNDRFYILYEQLVSAMTDFGNVKVSQIEEILIEISKMFRLSKGVTRVFRNPIEEKNDEGETLSCFDTGKEGVLVSYLRVVTSVLSSASMSVYMSPDEKPLSEIEKWRVELVMRTILSFISRNRLGQMVDQLTYYDEYGYPNLRCLNKDIFEAIAKKKINGMVAFRYNLRNFSFVNDEFGRDVGDKVMKAHFERLNDLIGDGGFCARLGGDNFVGVCPAKKFSKVKAFLTQADFAIDDRNSISIQTKAGIFCISDNDIITNPGDILGKIISAYNVAKGGEKEHIVIYDDSLISRKEKSMRIQQLLPDALKEEEFKPFYQPKVNIVNGTLVGAEALCRWFHGGKIVPPNDFISVLEQSSDICRLDLYMLEHVCMDLRKWLDEGIDVVRISVNFSRKHMMNIGLPEVITEIVDRYNIPHKYIEIELTETTTDVEFIDLKRLVSNLHQLGFCTSIDDFGMGFSSLNLIRDIPWDVVKIDRSFLPVEGDNEKSPNYIMYKHVVAMAKELGRECLTEGTESDYHISILKENNCDLAQGYYYDKPLPTEEFTDRLLKKKY